jgi:hypothetical protein
MQNDNAWSGFRQNRQHYGGRWSTLERNMTVNGRELNFATTYDGDSQYNVQVRSGDKLVTMFKIAADSESDVFPAALAHLQADMEMGNVKL